MLCANTVNDMFAVVRIKNKDRAVRHKHLNQNQFHDFLFLSRQAMMAIQTPTKTDGHFVKSTIEYVATDKVNTTAKIVKIPFLLVNSRLAIALSPLWKVNRSP